MMQTPPKVVYLVIVILGLLAFIGVSSLCGTLFVKNYADPAVLTAVISLSSTLVGSLGTVLVSTRSQQAGSNTEMTITTTTKSKPTTQEPAPVVVTNAPENPVPTTET